ncbi:uncharacterized protein LOC119687678 [Teleopsis dalmanni]|uniref:uncharacterized protein LOC119687678 n=1 Tax=Teleopsis dalmanni TaxID=139649 RepID=UPI0018CCD98F|nr:uncharacterized protein LOC119687678 [Teleopsis dalmanni]
MIESSISDNATKPESITLKYKGDGTSVSPKDRQYGGDTIFQNNDCPLTSEQFLRARQKFVLLENANSTNDRNASAGKDVNKNKNSSKPVEANRNLPKEFAETSYSTINTEHEINLPFQPLLYEGSASTVSPVELNTIGTTDLQKEFDFKTIRNKFENWAEPKNDNVKRLIAKLERKTKTSKRDGRDKVKRKKEYGKMIYEENNTENDEGNNHRTNPK